MRVIADQEREPFRTRDGSLVRELCQVGDGARNQSLAEATVPPRAETIEHLHPASEEIYRFISGAGRMPVLLCCCSPPYSDDDTVLFE